MIKLKIDERLEELKKTDPSKTAYWLAGKAGVNHGSLWRMRSNKVSEVRLHTLEALCNALECTPGDLLVIEDEKPESKKKSKSKA
jgi:putative transcriptional regulator